MKPCSGKNRPEKFRAVFSLYSTVTLFARFRGLSMSQPSPQKHCFCGDPFMELKSSGVNPADFKILRWMRKILVRRTCGGPARLRPFFQNCAYSTVTLLARFRGLSMSQPSPQKHCFCGDPFMELKSSGVNPADFKILRWMRKILVRRTCGGPARLRPFFQNCAYSTVTLLARFRGLSMSQPRWRAT